MSCWNVIYKPSTARLNIPQTTLENCVYCKYIMEYTLSRLVQLGQASMQSRIKCILRHKFDTIG